MSALLLFLLLLAVIRSILNSTTPTLLTACYLLAGGIALMLIARLSP